MTFPEPDDSPVMHVNAHETSLEQHLSVSIQRKLPGFHLDISFDVAGGLTVLFGPSGSGKSMTLQALAGLLPLEQAHITLGETVWQDSRAGIFVPPQQRRVGYVPQNYALFPHLTVAQNIAFGMAHNSRAGTKGARTAQAQRVEQDARVAELVSLVQLDGLEQRKPSQLSGGQQQRVALARALAVNPRLLLLDEPLSALDAAVRETLREELRAFYERVRIPTLLVTHDLQEVQQLADTVVVMQQGRVQQVGSQQEVFRSPRTPEVAALIGMRPCFTGVVRTIETVQRNGTQVQRGTLQVGNEEMRIILTQGQHLEMGQQVECAIRAGELELVRDTATITQEEDAVLLAGVLVREHVRGHLHILIVQLTCGIRVEVLELQHTWRKHPLILMSAVIVRVPESAVYVFEKL
jgi:molybdate transport system ATP-binding protein